MNGNPLVAPTAQATGAHVEDVGVSAYQVPTSADEESDGTLVWESTTIVVVELRCGEHTGLGYTYCHPSAGQVIESKLAEVRKGADPLMPQKAWCELQMQSRQMGQLRSQVQGWVDDGFRGRTPV
jgi:hypothetical protein